ncbi:MAG: ornithine carbamoyltransferase [Rhodobiaceae bacterium]|jgi:ornithine carbamoyltransferase|nr:ornithine carbamoyltransferase [Rhodobiaceae bacterium]MBT5641310.1 ornithine carbamoyltransferase [Rhodobiaceae bacterium]MBT6222733.1 ornithine carbamoyltransferase [Rhodobiaceae bacterium]
MKNTKLRHFINISEIESTDLQQIIANAHILKNDLDSNINKYSKLASKKSIAMMFEKPSTRTRVSFEVAINQLGASSLFLPAGETQLGRGETVSDTAHVLSKYINAIIIRSSKHSDLIEFANNATIPVINGLSDLNHPCQIMADIMTFEEKIGNIQGRKIAWCGDGNNVANTWIEASEKFNFELHLACPDELQPSAEITKIAKKKNAKIFLTHIPEEAIKNADCVITDTWVSMGDKDTQLKKQLLEPFQINSDLMKIASTNAIFMHCLPAHRGEEVTKDVIDGGQSVIWDEAENRLHVQKAIIAWCMGMKV